jgi:hypothetical protein
MKFFKYAILTLIITGCISSEPQTRDEIFEMNLVEYLKSNMHDPASLEIIEIRLIDSVSYLENIEYRKSRFIDHKKFAEYQLETYESNYLRNKYLKKYFKQEEYDQYLKDIEKEKWLIDGIDSIAKTMGENVKDIASFLYSVTLRGKNGYGANSLNSIYVQTTSAPEYKIHHIAENYGDIDMSPNNFPGYIDLVLMSQEKFGSVID